MKAAVYYGPSKIQIEDYSKPKPQADNMIIKVICCLICGTDLKIWNVGNPRVTPPRVLGHEMVGYIAHIGWENSGFKVGERITLATTISCGKCAYCKIGLGNLCFDAKGIGTATNGAFAEYVEVSKHAVLSGNVVRVPDGVKNEAAALSEPLSCAINAHSIINVKENDNIVIVGGGPLGAIHTELAKAEGAKRVILIEISKERLVLLEKFKNIILIDGSTSNPLERVREYTNGLGADKAIICAPAAVAFESSLQLVRKGGAISFFASLPKGRSDLVIDSRLIHYNELRLAGASDSRPEHVEKAVEILNSSDFDSESIVTHRLQLENILDGFMLMKEAKSLKVAIYPNDEFFLSN